MPKKPAINGRTLKDEDTKRAEQLVRRKAAKAATSFEDQTFEALKPPQKDELLKALAISARLILPS